MKNSNKDHLSLLKKGYLIKPVENKKSLNYINVFFKKRLLKEKNFKKIKKFNFNNLHKYIPVSELNEVRLKLIKEMNLDKKFRNHLFLLAKKNLYEMVGNELAMQNNINLSYRLMMLPKNVIDYVIIHELVHTKIKNHSKDFWTELASYDSDYKQSITWINHHRRDFPF